MAITRLGSLTQNNLQLFHIRSSQVKLADIETQITTGKKTQRYAGISRDVPALLAAENELARIKRFEQNIVTAEERLMLSEVNLAGMQDIGEQLRMITQISPVNYELEAEQGQNFLRLFADLMNAKDSTRYLFGGTNTDGTPPVIVYPPGEGPAADPAADPPVFGSPEANAANSNAGWRFQINATGANTDTQVQINDTMFVTVQYTATNMEGGVNQTNAFQELLSALVALADLDNTALYPDPSQDDIEVARTHINNALQGSPGNYLSFNDMRTLLSTTNKSIDTVKNMFMNVKNLSINTVMRVEDIDETEAAIRLREALVQLEATYAAVQQINRLSLLDYL